VAELLLGLAGVDDVDLGFSGNPGSIGCAGVTSPKLPANAICSS